MTPDRLFHLSFVLSPVRSMSPEVPSKQQASHVSKVTEVYTHKVKIATTCSSITYPDFSNQSITERAEGLAEELRLPISWTHSPHRSVETYMVDSGFKSIQFEAKTKTAIENLISTEATGTSTCIGHEA